MEAMMGIVGSLLLCIALAGKPAMAEEMDKVRIYDISLSEDLQRYTFELCKDRKLDYEMVLALMKIESNYNPKLISKTNDYGIMQINTVNHCWLREQLGITDFLDPRQSILCGVTMLGNLREKYDENHKILMAYNFGEGGARKHWRNNVFTSRYSRKVMAIREEIIEGGMK